MKTRTWGLSVGGLLLAALVLAPGLALAQQSAIGTVDTGRIAIEYKGMQALNEQFGDFRQMQEAKLMERQKVMMLTDADHTKYFDLRQAAAPTEETKKQIADLEALSKQREEKYRALVEKKDRTAEEQKDFDEMQKIYTARVTDLRALQGDLAKAEQDKRDQLTKVITTSLDAAIKSVADAKKMTLVVAKEAVLFGGTDITTEVLERLNALPSAPAG